MPRHPHNDRMLIILLGIILLVGLFFETVDFFTNNKKKDENRFRMEQFDKVLFGESGLHFKDHQIVSQKEINDYDCYVNPRYGWLCDEMEVYDDVRKMSSLLASEREKRCMEQENLVRFMEKADTTSGKDRTLIMERLKLKLMRQSISGNNAETMQGITRRMKEINDSLHRFEFLSLGYEYIVVATDADNSKWQITMVAPKSDPTQLSFVGGKKL